MANENTYDYDQFNTRFFRYLDTPMMIFIFESDEFMIGFGVYMVTMLTGAVTGLVVPGGVITYAFVSILTMFIYIKFKKNKPTGYIFSKLYRWGLLEPRSFFLKRKLTKKEKQYKVLPYGFMLTINGN